MNNSKENMKVFSEIENKAKNIFINPTVLYPYEHIINGCKVTTNSGQCKKMYAVATNTFRGFHRKDTNGNVGPKELFTGYFNDNKDNFISELKKINSEKELNAFEDDICLKLKSILKKYIKEDMLKSYNKLRKPVDLYIEHLVSMAEELDDERGNLIKYIFLPLDSQMFASDILFTVSELYKFNLTRKSTFKEVYSARNYIEMQKLVAYKANEISTSIGRNFHRIYFDLIWNERYKKTSRNLFETNP